MYVCVVMSKITTNMFFVSNYNKFNQIIIDSTKYYHLNTLEHDDNTLKYQYLK